MKTNCSVAVLSLGLLLFAATGSNAQAAPPIALTLKGAWPVPAQNLAVHGQYAYVAAGEGGLVILDVSDSTNPTRVSGYSTVGSAGDVVVAGNYAYVAAAGRWDQAADALVGGGLLVIDVRDPLNPTRVGGYTNGFFANATALTVSGDYAYLVGTGCFWEDLRLEMIDVRNPVNPVHVGNYRIFYDCGEIGVAVSGNHAFLAPGSAGLKVLEVSAPDEPVVVGGCGYPTTDIVRGVALAGNYAYVAKESPWRPVANREVTGGLEIIDVSNPASPVDVGRREGSAFRVAVSGNHAYVLASHWWDEATQTLAGGIVQVIDVSDPAHPVLVGGYDTAGLVQGLAVVGNLVYVADGQKGILVLQAFLQPRLEIIASNPFRFSISGEPGLTVRIQRSSNLREWADWQSVILGAQPIQLSDPDAATRVAIFYRAVGLPEAKAQPGSVLPCRPAAWGPGQETALPPLCGAVHRTVATPANGNLLARVDLQGPIEELRPAEPFRPPGPPFQEFGTNAGVAAMMEGVGSEYLASLVSQLSGDEPVPAGGELRRIQNRDTYPGSSLGKALEFAYEIMEALNLNPAYYPWSHELNPGSHEYLSSSNLVGTQVGTVDPDQVVLITAHLDSTAYGTFAPGADDDASGCAAVLTAAAVLSQYRFERTVRYVLFTGEEQRGLGSEAYAAAAATAGDKIQAVLNLDMIGWDASGGPVLLLYTRSTNHSAYAADLAIASVFTNVVAGYGLELSPLIIPDSSFIYSDHASFWNHGYAAILATEHYGSDLNPYYHSHNDLLCRLNIPYFTAFARAAIGTVAHLAGPVEPRAFDVVRIVSGDWNVTKQKQNFGASVFHARHLAGAQETTDASDLPWASRPARANAAWLALATRPGDDDLATDSRPLDSGTPFAGRLSAFSAAGSPISCTNRLRFVFLTPPNTNRLYTVEVAVHGQFTAQGADFRCVTNLLELVAAGGFLELPALTNVPSGTTYGTCNLAPCGLSAAEASTGWKAWRVEEDPFVVSGRPRALDAHAPCEMNGTVNVVGGPGKSGRGMDPATLAPKK